MSERYIEILDRMEKFKEIPRIQYDYFKHLTTLCGSALLIIVAFLEKVFEKPDCIIFAGISISSLALCVLGSVWALPVTGNMILYLTGIRMVSMPRTEKSEEKAKDLGKKYENSLKIITVLEWLTKITLLLGIATFLVFLLINFFSGKSFR